MLSGHGDQDEQAMLLTYDELADAVYVYFNQNEVDHTEEVSGEINVDFDAAGKPVGVEFLDVSDGIDLDKVPHRDAVARLLQGRDFRVFA
jgi:uncharacterized protein YuzE